MAEKQIMVKIDHVSKEYRLGAIGGTTLREDLERFHAKIRKKEEEKICLLGYLKIKIRVKWLVLELLYVNTVNILAKDVIQDFATLVIQILVILVLNVEKLICKKKNLNSS